MVKKRRIVLLIAGLLLAVLFGCGPRDEGVTEIRFWHSYTGKQAEALSALVTKYNERYGKERNVRVSAIFRGTERELANHLINDRTKDLPNIIQADGNGAYTAYLSSKIVCAEDYLSDSALGGYIDGFLDAGRFNASSGVYLFPIYSEEGMLYVNTAALDTFSGNYPDIGIRNLSTWDGLYEAAEKYYYWTDSLTEDEENDGKPFFSVSDTGMFIVALTKQYASPIIQPGSRGINIVINPNTLRRIWDFYYSGVVRGYIVPASPDTPSMIIENSGVVCITASTKDARYMPVKYVSPEGIMEDTVMAAYSYPFVDNNKNSVIPVKIRGVAVTDKGERENLESFLFLDWLCSERETYKFCVEQGSIPVKYNLLSDSSIIYEIYDFANESRREKNEPVVYAEAYRQAYASDIYCPVSFSGCADFLKELSKMLEDTAISGRYRVFDLMDEGMSYAEAVAAADTDEEFENWINKLEQIKNKY